MADPSAEERERWRSEHSYPDWQENRLNKTCQARDHSPVLPPPYWPCLTIRWLDALDERDEAQAEAERYREALREVMEDHPWRDELWRFTDETEAVLVALEAPR